MNNIVQARDMDVMTLALVLGLVFMTSLLFAPLGLGGGMLFVPILHYVAGWEIDGALIMVSLTLATVVSYGSGLAHRKQGHWSTEVRNSALWGAIPGVMIGVLIVSLLGDKMELAFKVVSIMMILWAIQKTWNKIKADAVSAVEVTGEQGIKQAPLIIGSGIGGILSAVLGIGSGIINIPLLRQYTDLKTRTAIGTSFGIMMVVVPFAVIIHSFALSAGQLAFLSDENILLFGPSAIITTFIGAQIGAKVGLKYLPTKVVMSIFFGLLIVVLIRYILDLISNVNLL
jgi:uncharacterized membrane protein YfcA